MILGVLSLSFVAAYMSFTHSRSLCDNCSSLSFKSEFMIRFNLFGKESFSGSKSLGWGGQEKESLSCKCLFWLILQHFWCE